MAVTPTGPQGNSQYAMDQFQQAYGITPLIFGQNTQYNSLKTNNLVQSDAVTTDPIMSGQLSQPGREIVLPFYDDLYADVQDWSDGSNIDVNSFGSGEQRGVKIYEAQAFGFTDLSRITEIGDPLNHITSRINPYWVRQNTKDILNVLTGVFNNQKIKNTNVYDGSDKTFNVVDLEKAASYLGAYQDNAFSTLFVHPSIYAQMKTENYLTLTGNDTPLSQSSTPIATYNGMRVIQDESLPIDDNGVATSYLIGTGTIKFSAVAGENGGIEYYRHPGIAGGTTNIYSKRIASAHIDGTTVAEGYRPMNGQSYTAKDFANPDMWDMVINPEYLHMVAYKSKLGDGFKGKFPDEEAIASQNRQNTVKRNSQETGNSSSSSNNSGSNSSGSTGNSSSSSKS